MITNNTNSIIYETCIDESLTFFNEEFTLNPVKLIKKVFNWIREQIDKAIKFIKSKLKKKKNKKEEESPKDNKTYALEKPFRKPRSNKTKNIDIDGPLTTPNNTLSLNEPYDKNKRKRSTKVDDNGVIARRGNNPFALNEPYDKNKRKRSTKVDDNGVIARRGNVSFERTIFQADVIKIYIFNDSNNLVNLCKKTGQDIYDYMMDNYYTRDTDSYKKNLTELGYMSKELDKIKELGKIKSWTYFSDGKNIKNLRFRCRDSKYNFDLSSMNSNNDVLKQMNDLKKSSFDLENKLVKAVAIKMDEKDNKSSIMSRLNFTVNIIKKYFNDTIGCLKKAADVDNEYLQSLL